MTNNDDQKNIILIFDSIEHEKSFAYRVSFGDKAVWLPKSLITISDIDMKIKLPLWLALCKGIEIYKE